MDSESNLDSDDAAAAAEASPRSWSPGESLESERKSGVTRMRWARAKYSDFRGEPPSPRCGHTAVCIGHSKVVFFGGFARKRFLNDIFVYDTDHRLWYRPGCTGSGSDGQGGPCPRAFHVALPIDNRMFLFGGRTETHSLGDLWMLDTSKGVWQWSALQSFGDLPSPREFSSAAVLENNKIVMCGGWNGRQCLYDLYLLDTRSLEWKNITVSGLVPPPRCGHSVTVIDKMLVIFGGRGGTNLIFSDLWALNGIAQEEDAGGPTWTQLNLLGQPMHARCGHSVTSGGHHLMLFGGHGTEGWHKECIILHMGTQWTSLQTSNEPPPPRSYHSMTCIGSRFLLFGGFDGKRTFADLWWLVIEDDPLAKRALVPNVESDSLSTLTDAKQVAVKETVATQSDQIKLYTDKHFQQKVYNVCCSWRKRVFKGIYIIPPARCQLRGDCAYHATCAIIECHCKMMLALKPVEGRTREFHVRLSHLHLKEMVQDFMASGEGKKYKPGDKLEVCLLMAERHGIVSEEDYAAGCPPQAYRYKLRTYRQLFDVKKKKIPELLLRGAEMVLSSFRISDEYLQLLPHEIYRYRPERALERAPESQSHATTTPTHDAHCVVLISPGYAFKDEREAGDEEVDQSADAGAVPQPELYYEYLNSYSPGWGLDGCGAVYEESLRKTYRVRVEDI